MTDEETEKWSGRPADRFKKKQRKMESQLQVNASGSLYRIETQQRLRPAATLSLGLKYP